MPTTFTFTTDDATVASHIMQVIQGRVPEAAATTKASPPAPLETPSMAAPAPSQTAVPHAGNSAAPSMPGAAPAAPQFAPPPTGVGMPDAAPALQQAIEATNAALDKFLQSHKATEAKTILQKYGIKRISEATDMATLQNIHREFSA